MTKDFIDISKWGSFSIKSQEIYHWKTDKLNILIKKENDILKIYHYKSENELNIDEILWQDWLIKEDNDLIIDILPSYPDKTIVLKFKRTFSILKKQKKQISVIIPIWVKIKIKQKDIATEILTIPVTESFKGWFGDLSDGELCYYITPEQENTNNQLYFLKLPISVINNSEKNSLIIEKFAIQPKYLSIFENQELSLSSDDINVIFKSDGDVSIAMSNLNKKSIKSPLKEINSKLVEKKVFQSINLDQTFYTYNLPIKK